MESKITKKKKIEKKRLYRDIYRYRDIELVISWYKILVISPTPNYYYYYYYFAAYNFMETMILLFQILWWIKSSRVSFLPLFVVATWDQRSGLKVVSQTQNHSFLNSSGLIHSDIPETSNPTGALPPQAPLPPLPSPSCTAVCQTLHP